MRRILMVLLACLVLPTAQGLLLAEDAQGDAATYVETAAGTQPVPVAEQNLDLASLSMEELPAAFRFQVAMYPSDLSMGDVYVHLAVGERSYAVRMDGGGGIGAVFNVGPEGRLAFLGDLESTVVQGTTLTQDVGRDWILDQDGAPPLQGSEIRDLRAMATTSASVNVVLASTTTRDDLPDHGEGPSWTVLEGPVQQGDARLWSPRPSRASNGAAATYLYEAYAKNAGTEAKAFQLSAVDVPPSWEVRVSRPDLVLAPGEQAAVPIVVTIPFGHEHGSVASLRLVLEGGPDDRAELPLQVNFLRVPQPTGHHNTLWIHSHPAPGDPRAQVLPDDLGYMNTLEEDDQDTREPLHGRGGTVNYLEIRWTFFLEPSLELGLQLAAGQTGELVFDLENEYPMASGSIEATLDVWTANGSVEIAHVDPMPWVAPTGGTSSFQGVLVPNPDVDVVHIERQAAMTLQIRASPLGPDQDLGDQLNAAILPGAFLVLPLLEYHDPLDDALALAPDLELHAKTTYHLRPEATYWLPVDVTNLGTEAADYLMEVSATVPQNVQVAPTLRVPAKSTATAWVRLVAPADEDLMDLVVHAAAQDQAGVYRRIHVQFGPDGEGPDAYPEPASGAEAAPFGPLGILALGGAWAVRRRRAHP